MLGAQQPTCKPKFSVEHHGRLASHMPSKVVLSRVATLFIVGSTLQELAVQLLQRWVQMLSESEWDLKDLQEALGQCGWLKLLPVGWGV